MKKNHFKKLVALLLTINLFIMTIDLTPTKAASTTKNVNLNVNGLVNPGTPSAATDAWGKGIGSYIYFGTYPQSDKNGTTKEPIRFRVLNLNSDSNSDGTTDSIFILSDMVLDKIKFNTSRSAGNSFTSSNLSKWLNSNGTYTGGHAGGFYNTAFNTSEKKIILNTTWNEDENEANVENHVNPLVGSDLKGEKIFVLSAKESTNPSYGFFKTALAKSNKTLIYMPTNYSLVGRTYKYTWLRSPVKGYTYLVGMNLAHSNYTQATFDNFYVDSLLGVVPAMNINKSSIAFNTAIDYKKGNFSVISNDKVSSDWNITLSDGTGFLAIRKPGEIGKITPGSTVTVQIKALPTNATCTYTQISGMLIDANGNVACYGKLSSNLLDSEIKVTIPSSLPNGEYKMYVFAEDVNSTTGNYVDFASNMVELKSTKIALNSVAVKNVTIPDANETFSPSVTCNTAGIKDCSALLKQGNNTVSGPLKYSTSYTIEITLNALDNYAFSTSTTATLNNQNATVKYISESKIMLTYTFTTQNEPPTEPPTQAPTQEPTTEPNTEPTTEAPTEEPTTEEPTEGPTTEEPTQEPTTQTSTEEPTTQATTKEPTTQSPTEPTTQAPTKEANKSNLKWLWIVVLLVAGGVSGAIGYKIKSKNKTKQNNT